MLNESGLPEYQERNNLKFVLIFFNHELFIL